MKALKMSKMERKILIIHFKYVELRNVFILFCLDFLWGEVWFWDPEKRKPRAEPVHRSRAIRRERGRLLDPSSRDYIPW